MVIHIKKSHQREFIISKLSKDNAAIYESLPSLVAKQLTLDRDPHGNVQVSQIETEKLLSDMVGRKLAQWSEEGKYVGKFSEKAGAKCFWATFRISSIVWNKQHTWSRR